MTHRRSGRGYLRFGLSYRDVEELLTERGIVVDHIAGHAFVQNIRRGHHELAAEASTNRWVAAAFHELALAI